MRSVRAGIAFGCLIACSGCLRTTEYRCEGDQTCGGGGTCEVTGFCSFSDAECASGRRYNASAGSLAGTCTGGGGSSDDATQPLDDSTVPTDGTTGDTPVALCPNGYNAITGGQTGHLYMFIATPANWNDQEAACQLTTVKSHLVVPDDLAELTATDALAGGTNRYWIGISDPTENTFVTVLGAAATFLPWDPPAPDDASPGEDCVEAIPATHELNDERCNTTRPAVCECAP